jgi:hypothetical protein
MRYPAILLSCHQGRRCSCTSTRRNICMRKGDGRRNQGRKEVQQRRRRQHCPHRIPVPCALCFCKRLFSSSSSSAGISGFSRHPLSLAISEASSPIYTHQFLLSFPARERARSSFTPRFLLGGCLCAAILERLVVIAPSSTPWQQRTAMAPDG